MTTLPTPSVRRRHAAHYFDQHVIDRDDECIDCFLSDDFHAVSEFAVRSGIAVFVTGSHLPMKDRTRLVAEIRAKDIGKAAGLKQSLADFLASLQPAEREKILSGAVPIHEIDVAADNWKRARDQEISEVKTAYKEALRKSARAALLDGDEVAENTPYPVPRAIVTLEDGRVGLFARRHSATTWAQNSNCPHTIVFTDTTTFRFCSPDDAEVMRRVAALRAEKAAQQAKDKKPAPQEPLKLSDE